MINLNLSQMLTAALIPIVLVFISYRYRLNKERDIISSTTKMTIQLFIVGYILIYLMENTNPIIASLYVSIMLFFAIRTFKTRIKTNYNKALVRAAILAMFFGSFGILIYFILFVIRPQQIFDPQYIIPIYGMILGNTLTAITLAYNSLIENLKSEQIYINTLIGLGVDPHHALDGIRSKTISTAITPVITSLTAMGLVSLPGAMTGQILSGISPVIAVKYQIAIMLAILGSNAIATIIFTFLSSKIFINKYNQINLKI